MRWGIDHETLSWRRVEEVLRDLGHGLRFLLRWVKTKGPQDIPSRDTSVCPRMKFVQRKSE